ncbi:MAG: NAD(P)-binding domain-containing protein [Nitrososphaeraceae archaeon]
METEKETTTRRFNKVLIIGLGQIGFAVASYIKKQEKYDVYGYDISSAARDRAESKIGIKNAADFTGFDIYMVCISTHNRDDMFTPDTSGLKAVANKLSQEGKEAALVVIESTVPQGTSREFCETVGHKLHVVHAPHRWYAVEENDHGVNQPRVIGGVHDCCLKLGMEFFSGTDSVNGNPKTYNGLGVPMMPLSKIEIAELTKIIENSHRYLQISFAEELFLYCQASGVDFWELRKALNTKWNVNILEPREGIGGHCLPKDTKMFLNSSNLVRSKIISAAIEADEEYKRAVLATSPTIKGLKARFADTLPNSK